MKVFIISIAIISVVISGGIGSSIYINNVAEDIEGYSVRMSKAALDEKYDELEKIYSDMQTYWEKKKRNLAALVDHAHISEVDKAMSEIEIAIKAQENIEVLLSMARAKTTLSSVAQNECFNVNNLL